MFGFSSRYNLIIIFTALIFLSSCGEDDLKNATAISSKKIILTKDRSYGVDVIYSDSAIVKAQGFAPILDKVKPAQGSIYNEMPDGVKIKFFDAYLQVTGTITSDYAIYNETERITVFKKNVIVVNDQMTFTTEELTWNENTKTYSSPYGTVIKKDGSTLNGMQFSAPQDFSTYTIREGSAKAFVKEGIIP